MGERRARTLTDPRRSDRAVTATDHSSANGADGTDSSFYTWDGPRPRVDPADPSSGTWPIYLHRGDGFWSVHAAWLDAIVASQPSERLHPVQLPDGRAVVMVAALHKRALTDGNDPGRVLPPYAEVMVAAAVTLRPLSRLERLLMLVGRPPAEAGWFVLHLPCTSGFWRDGARRSSGAPVFVADLAFSEDTAERRVRVSEGDSDILTLVVRPGGRVVYSTEPQVLYTAHEGRLLRLAGRFCGYQQQRRGAAGSVLELGGEHPVARDLRRLGLSAEALMSGNWPSLRAILAAGSPIGDARPYEGWAGTDREFGRYTVAYPGASVIDERTGDAAPPDRDAVLMA